MSLMSGPSPSKQYFNAKVLASEPAFPGLRVCVRGSLRPHHGSTLFQTMTGKPDDLTFVGGQHGPGSPYHAMVRKEAVKALREHSAWYDKQPAEIDRFLA